MAGGDWGPVPGIAWPQALNEYTDPRPLAEVSRFYRILTPESGAVRGKLLSIQLLQTLSRTDIQILLSLVGVEMPVSNGVHFIKLEYETVGPSGEVTTASGGLAVPAGVPGTFPLVSYQHGTILERSGAPSSFTTESIIAVSMAASGYVCAAPDYLGLGSSAFPFHPYHHAKTEASAVVDMLRASRNYASLSNISLNGKVFLLGYSQGGHATLAAHRAIEQLPAREFDLVASAPGAGAYDLSGVTLTDSLSSRQPPNPYYFAYLVTAYQRIYQIAPSVASLFRPPYNVQIPPLLDGFHTSEDLNNTMPRIPTESMDPTLLAQVRADPEHPFRKALRENDLLDWSPVAPIQLYHCTGDQDVLYANSEVALARLRANGGKSVELVNRGPMDHGGCVISALLGAKEWFDSLK